MARMMIAFVGAYILGRMKKFKLAIAWFGLMTGYKLKLSPDQLLEQGSRLVEASPQLQQLVAALRGPLLEAVKQAATSAATAQLTGLADQLANRIEDLGRASEQQPTTSGSAGSGSGTGDARAGGSPRRTTGGGARSGASSGRRRRQGRRSHDHGEGRGGR